LDIIASEEEIRLRTIADEIDRYISSGVPILVDSYRFLEKIYNIATGQEDNRSQDLTEEGRVEKIVVSCDASIKKNPGGPASAAWVIQVPGKKPVEGSQETPATTNNQAEYDAVYQGLVTLMNLVNYPQVSIEIRSDSQLVIQQLRGEMKCSDPKLERKRAVILELVQMIPAPVTFSWLPRNSTPELSRANTLAQTLLGVKPH
jgi:ribonuclease HI